MKTRVEFEQACHEQNQRREAEVAEARAKQVPCETVVMMAFGGETYCRTHRVMGPCPFGQGGAR